MLPPYYLIFIACNSKSDMIWFTFFCCTSQTKYCNIRIPKRLTDTALRDGYWRANLLPSIYQNTVTIIGSNQICHVHYAQTPYCLVHTSPSIMTFSISVHIICNDSAIEIWLQHFSPQLSGSNPWTLDLPHSTHLTSLSTNYNMSYRKLRTFRKF